MSHKTSLTPEEQRTEALLGQFQPMDAPQSRDKLMFQAGCASAGHVRLWQGISSVFAVLLLCSLMIHSVPSGPESAIVTPQFASNTWQFQPDVPSSRELDEQAYINVRHSVLKHGLDALPETKSGRGAAADRMRYGDAFKRYMAL